MRLPGSDALELLTDFVQGTYADLEGMDPFDPADQTRRQEQVRAEQDRARVSDRLAQATKDAGARKDTQLKTLLERLQKAIEPGATRDAALYEALKNPSRLLEQDAFGAQRPALPPAVKEALEFIARYQVPEAQPDAQPNFEAPAEPTELQLPEALEGYEQGPFEGEVFAERQDPRVREFVAQYFAEAFDDAPPPKLMEQPPSPVTEIPELPAFEAMTPEEQHFVLTATDREIGAYAKLPHDLKSVYRELKPEQRGEFLKLSADEKEFVRQLDPEDRQLFLALNPDHRARLRQLSPEQRTAYFGELKAQQAAAQKEPPEKLARTLGESILRSLGVAVEKKPQLLEQARALAFNYLHQSKGDLLTAQTGTMKALLNLPQVQQAVESELTAALKEAAPQEAAELPQPGMRARRPAGDYLGHLGKIRHALPELAQRMVQPGLSREQLVEGMRKAVVLSADYATAYPPRKSGGRADPVRRGMLGRTLRG